MSAELSSILSNSFSQVTNTDKFFSRADLNKIRKVYEPREQPKLGVPGESCKTNLFFGFFLDGTKNNYIQAELGKNHSAVARLYDCYPGLSVPGVLPASTDWKTNPERYTHFFKTYVPGVASPFRQVHDSGEGVSLTLGAASGKMGERRIVWTLVQAINNVHRYFLKTPLVTQSDLETLYRRVILTKYSMRNMDSVGRQHRTNDKEFYPLEDFEDILRRLHAAIKPHMVDPKTKKPEKTNPGIVETIFVSVFGFSRGATQARAFLNWLQALCRLDATLSGKSGMTLGGFPVVFDFLGLFDTVASVGAGNTLGNNIFGRLYDGHGGWADAEVSLRVPAGVKCLHLVAAHELRRSFPVDSISVKGTLPPGCEEVVVPGVHSDLGCGYSPKEQGRGTDANGDDMLARIPLLLMYKAARLNGVPLKPELASPVAQSRMAIKLETINAFNAYIATCTEKKGPIHVIMREQARKQMEWRLARRTSGPTPIQGTASFKRASSFDQNDLYSAHKEFEDEIAQFLLWRNKKGRAFQPAGQEPGFDNEHEAEWEEIATWWDKHHKPGEAVLHFFDEYVHDSRAWFKLIPKNPDNEKDAHEQLAKWAKHRKSVQAHNEMELKLFNSGILGAKPGTYKVGPFTYRYIPAHDGLTDDQRRAADEYAKTGRIPRYITTGREPFDSSWNSWGLSGKAGYLRFRKIYGGYDFVLLSVVPGTPAYLALVDGTTRLDNTLATG